MKQSILGALVYTGYGHWPLSFRIWANLDNGLWANRLMGCERKVKAKQIKDKFCLSFINHYALPPPFPSFPLPLPQRLHDYPFVSPLLILDVVTNNVKI